MDKKYATKLLQEYYNTRVVTRERINKYQNELNELEREYSTIVRNFPLLDVIFTKYNLELDSGPNISLQTSLCLILEPKQSTTINEVNIVNFLLETLNDGTSNFDLSISVDAEGYEFHLIKNRGELYLSPDNFTMGPEAIYALILKAKKFGTKVTIAEETLQVSKHEAQKRITNEIYQISFMHRIRDIIYGERECESLHKDNAYLGPLPNHIQVD